jgi:hypothetical protein
MIYKTQHNVNARHIFLTLQCLCNSDKKNLPVFSIDKKISPKILVTHSGCGNWGYRGLTASGGTAFGRWLGHKDGAPETALVTLQEETP